MMLPPRPCTPFARHSIFPAQLVRFRESKRKRGNNDECDWRDDMWRARGLARRRASRGACRCRRGAHARPRSIRQSRIASSLFCPCFCNGYGFLLFQKRGNDRPGSWAAPRILEGERAPTLLVRLLRGGMKAERRRMDCTYCKLEEGTNTFFHPGGNASATIPKPNPNPY